MDTVTINRIELYNLIWTIPITTLSKQLNISDAILRNIITKFNIPMPPFGYWQKIKFGKIIEKVALQTNYKGISEITIQVDNINQKFTLQNPLSILTSEIEMMLGKILMVSGRLTNPDKLIIAAHNVLKNKTASRFDKMILNIGGELDIKTTNNTAARALRIMDTLLKVFRARGHQIVIKERTTYVIIKEQKFKICLREKSKRELIKDSTSKWNSFNDVPTGTLVFKMDAVFYKKEWSDDKIIIEDQIATIIAKLEIISDDIISQRNIWKIQRDESDRIHQLKVNFEEQKRDELLNFRKMLHDVERWQKSIDLRNYINTIEENALKNSTLTDTLSSWIQWANKKADWYDPLVESEDDLLNDIDKRTLVKKNTL